MLSEPAKRLPTVALYQLDVLALFGSILALCLLLVRIGGASAIWAFYYCKRRYFAAGAVSTVSTTTTTATKEKLA
jgi:hypothetical protein